MNKNNLQLTILKAIGIIAVVSCHLGNNLLDVLSFPIAKNIYLFSEYSYHIPLFIFASGYFYKNIYENSVIKMIQKRFASIKMYLKCNLFYFILSFIFINIGILNRKIDFSLSSLLVEPFLGGFQFYFNGPGWFVPFLFLLQIVFTLLRKLISIKVKKLSTMYEKDIKLETLFLMFLIVVGFISLCICKYYPVVNDNILIWHSILRVLFGLQFYQIGYFYKEFLEEKIKFSLKSFVYLIVIKFIFIITVGDYTFSLRSLKFEQSVFLPIIVSILGILYALHLSNFIILINEKYKLKSFKYIAFIGENTWSIMMHHLLVKWSLKKVYPILLANSKYILFMEYTISPILSILLPLAFVYCLKNMKIKKQIEEKILALNITK